MNTCDCNKPKHGKNFPPKVLEIIQNAGPVLFHKTIFPASIGDEATNPPDTLDYKNVLLTYEATNRSYLYSSDGIPTLISMGEISVEEIEKELAKLGVQIVEMGNEISELQSGLTNTENAITDLQGDIASETLARNEADEALKTQIENETTARETADNTLTDGVNSLQQDVEHLGADIKELQDQTVQLDTTISTNGSTVTITKSQGTLLGEEPTKTAMPLPVASATEAGVMNPSTFTAIQENSEDIDSILNGAVAITGLAVGPTQDELTEQWKIATGLGELINRASIFDVENQKLWYYYTNTGEWYSVNNTPEVSVAQFTNAMAGIIKGSETEGQVFAEADGTGSIVGWDGIRHDVDNLLELLETTPVPKLYTSYSTATDGANTAAFINTILNSDCLSLGRATPMSNSTNSIAIGVEATTYWKGIAIGYQAKANSGNVNTQGNHGVAIGNGSVAKIRSVAIGNGAGDSTAIMHSYMIAIGAGATTGSNNATAIGGLSTASFTNSVALGYNSATSRTDEVSIGKGASSYTRYLANVTAGELDTDAVNVAQLNAAVGDIQTLLDNLNTGAGV